LKESIREEGKILKVLIISAGHCGLAVAVQLRFLNVPLLAMERNPKVGDNWRW